MIASQQVRPAWPNYTVPVSVGVCTLQYSTLHHSSNTVHHLIQLYSCIVHHCNEIYKAALSSTVLKYTYLYCASLHSTPTFYDVDLLHSKELIEPSWPGHIDWVALGDSATHWIIHSCLHSTVQNCLESSFTYLLQQQALNIEEETKLEINWEIEVDVELELELEPRLKVKVTVKLKLEFIS